jgi:hypothetical protein
MPDWTSLLPESYWVISGRFLAGEYPGRLIGEQTRQRLDALLVAGIDTFIDLTQAGELPSYLSILQDQAKIYERQVNYQRFPILDRGLPSHSDMVSTLNCLDEALTNGHHVYLHCWGGVGRTGTTVGCYLVRHGKTGQQAIHQLAGWWSDVPKSQIHPRSPETDEQMRFIFDWKE